MIDPPAVGRLDDWNADNADPPAVGQVRLLPAEAAAQAGILADFEPQYLPALSADKPAVGRGTRGRPKTEVGSEMERGCFDKYSTSYADGTPACRSGSSGRDLLRF